MLIPPTDTHTRAHTHVRGKQRTIPAVNYKITRLCLFMLVLHAIPAFRELESQGENVFISQITGLLALSAQMISAFVFAKYIVQSLFFLIKYKNSSFKCSENIQKKECGPARSVNQSSSVTLNKLAVKARKSYFKSGISSL